MTATPNTAALQALLERVVSDMADAFDALPDQISLYRTMKRSGKRKQWDLAGAIETDLQNRFGHIAENARVALAARAIIAAPVAENDGGV